VLRDGATLGWVGSLNPQVAQTMGLKGRVLLFELSLSALGQGRVPSYSALSRFPAIRRDLALVIDKEVTAQRLCDTVREVAGAWLIDLQLFDIYSGKGVDSNRKSLALGLTLQDPSRTLKDAEVDALVNEVVQHLRSDLGADLRE
jgi:phenylalanyl-tRNA synthetase beta chain